MRTIEDNNGNGNVEARQAPGRAPAPSRGEAASAAVQLHPAWRAFLLLCQELRHGEIEKLKIQDGLPVLAEQVRIKVKFAP